MQLFWSASTMYRQEWQTEVDDLEEGDDDDEGADHLRIII